MSKNDTEFLVQKIRSQYTEKENTQLDKLTALDKKVHRPAKIFAWVYGTVSALVMGSGMSLIMTDINKILGVTDPIFYGVIIGIIGILMSITTYPIYKKILHSRRKRYAGKIIELSNELMKG